MIQIILNTFRKTFLAKFTVGTQRIRSKPRFQFTGTKMTRLNRSCVGHTFCHRQIPRILNSCRTFGLCAILVIFLVQLSLVQPVWSGINHNEFLAQLKVPQCRKDCLDKVSHHKFKENTFKIYLDKIHHDKMCIYVYLPACSFTNATHILFIKFVLLVNKEQLQ